MSTGTSSSAKESESMLKVLPVALSFAASREEQAPLRRRGDRSYPVRLPASIRASASE